MTNDHKHEMEKIAVELGQSRDTLTELYRRAENVQQSEDCLGDGLPGSLLFTFGSVLDALEELQCAVNALKRPSDHQLIKT